MNTTRNPGLHVAKLRCMGIIMLMLIAGLASSCSGDKQQKVLTVSVEPQRAILQEIAGDRYTVRTLLPSGANPETFEPTIKARRDVDDAEAYFTVGNIPFEENLTKTLPGNVVVINTSEGITPIYGTHEHGDGTHNHRVADPHTWTSVKNARIMAQNMFNALVKMDPDGKEYYWARFRKLDNRLDSIDRAFESRLKNAPSRAFAVWHPSLSYFARDYGLEQISVGFENKEISPARMVKVVEHAKEHGVKTLFFQQEFDSRQAQSLNSALNANIVTINPLSFNWLTELEKVVSTLEK